MITDRLENISIYKNIPLEVVDFLSNLSAKTPQGRYDLSCGNYVNVEAYTTKNVSEGKFESHQNYIDIQLLLDGHERIFITDKNNLPVSVPYNAQKDIAFYSEPIEDKNYVDLDGTNFVMLFPHEAHAPQICIGENSTVIKAVAKIKI